MPSNYSNAYHTLPTTKGNKSMKTNLFILLLLICLSIPFMATAQTVYIPDPNLRAEIDRVESNRSDIASMTEFRAGDRNISNLTGLEHAISLTELVPCCQLDIGHLTAGRLNQPDKAEHLYQLDIRHLTGGGLDKTDNPVPY